MKFSLVQECMESGTDVLRGKHRQVAPLILNTIKNYNIFFKNSINLID